jgi:uncharacterized membrane protein (TIGR02234 family)
MSQDDRVTSPTDEQARRLRLLTILGLAALAGLELAAATQTWWTVRLSTESISVAGTVAAPALSALALTGLALAAALAIAGPVFRFILGILQLLLAFTVILTSAISVGDPQKSSESVVSKATGIAGDESIRALIKSVGLTPWGPVAICCGAVALLAGVFLLASFRRWPTASRKYQAVRFASGVNPETGERDAVIDWDALSDGKDPTDHA